MMAKVSRRAASGKDKEVKRLVWEKSWSKSSTYERLEFYSLLESMQWNREALVWQHTDLDPTDPCSGRVTRGRLTNLAAYQLLHL